MNGERVEVNDMLVGRYIGRYWKMRIIDEAMTRDGALGFEEGQGGQVVVRELECSVVQGKTWFLVSARFGLKKRPLQ